MAVVEKPRTKRQMKWSTIADDKSSRLLYDYDDDEYDGHRRAQMCLDSSDNDMTCRIHSMKTAEHDYKCYCSMRRR